jgi:hypothetical protein
MKLLALSLSLFTLAVNAEARTPITQQWAPLERFVVDPQMGEELERIDSGAVEIDLVKQKIRVTLYPRTDSRCLPTAKVIELPIQRVFKDACNISNYVAQTKSAAIGAKLETLIVKDTTQSECAMILPLAQTEVRYETTVSLPSGESETVSSRFEGEILRAGQAGPRALGSRCR